MVGITLVEIREHIEELANDNGEYYIVCGRTGDRPVPVARRRFAGRTTAECAVRATEQYRAALRRYDPQVPYYDLIVCQDTGSLSMAEDPPQSDDTHQRTLSTPILDGNSPSPERRDLVEFCHRVAAAIFETLSEDGYEAVESAVMDEYFELAETVDSPDELCLCLLESMATELDHRLDVPEQAEVLLNAATRLTPTDTTENPLEATLASLEARGMIGDYTRSPWSVDLDNGVRSNIVQVSDYALSPHDGRLPVLPIVLELYRRQPDHLPTSLQVVGQEDNWRIRFVLADTAEPEGLTNAPIDSGA